MSTPPPLPPQPPPPATKNEDDRKPATIATALALLKHEEMATSAAAATSSTSSASASSSSSQRTMVQTIDELSAAILGEQQKLVNAEREILGMIEHINQELNQLCVEELQLKSSGELGDGDGAAGGDGGGGIDESADYSVVELPGDDDYDGEYPAEIITGDVVNVLAAEEVEHLDSASNVNQQQLVLNDGGGMVFEVEEIEEDEDEDDDDDEDVERVKVERE